MILSYFSLPEVVLVPDALLADPGRDEGRGGDLVTSNAGFQTLRPSPSLRPEKSSAGGLSSIGMQSPSGQPRSSVDIGIPI